MNEHLHDTVVEDIDILMAIKILERARDYIYTDSPSCRGGCSYCDAGKILSDKVDHLISTLIHDASQQYAHGCTDPLLRLCRDRLYESTVRGALVPRDEGAMRIEKKHLDIFTREFRAAVNKAAKDGLIYETSFTGHKYTVAFKVLVNKPDAHRSLCEKDER